MQISIERYESNGKEVIRGEAIYQDVKFTYRVHKASSQKPDYKYVLKANIISPTTNRIMQYTGKHYNEYKRKLIHKIGQLETKLNSLDPSSEAYRKTNQVLNRQKEKKQLLDENLHIEDLNVSSSVYLKNAETKTIKAKFEQVILKLYGDYQDDIFAALNSTHEKDLHARTLYDMYQNDFFRSLPATSEATLKNKKSSLRNICDRLNHKSVSALMDNDIEVAEKKLGSKAQSKMKLAEHFFNFCGTVGGYTGVNPISLYYQNKGRTPSKKAPTNLTYPAECSHFSPKAEQRLHDNLKDTLNDEFSMAIPLAKGSRMSISRILTITWKDIIIDENKVLILDYHDQYTGGTHNYVRPPLGETASFLREKYNQLIAKHGKTKLAKMLVVPVPGKTSGEKKSALTKYIRRMLIQAGVQKEEMSCAADKDNPKSDGGAGYQLLIKHYDYVLEHRCGLALDSGLGHYLRGLRIYDTTTDYYRCLSDETGLHFLCRIMQRDDWSSGSPPPAPIVSAQSQDDYNISEYTVFPGNIGTRTGIVTSRPLYIPAGFEICISAPCGIEGDIHITKAQNDPPPTKHKDLF